MVTDDNDKGTIWVRDGAVNVKQMSCGKAGQFAYVEGESNAVYIRKEVTEDDPSGG